ncbi:phage tail tape measure protein [Periweissella cryptocerci]|uniref:Phage tail tape measure protein n=1 Tax=Periweissella cryptocerci TaxID=2506420 RepID=A0A4P6YWW7_9LACO|nr:phage tail tape measure protein [Periweissella cryptocerci]QBO37283.1 phage tail tape measure protein [Periweissella cryptocerci]
MSESLRSAIMSMGFSWDGSGMNKADQDFDGILNKAKRTDTQFGNTGRTAKQMGNTIKSSANDGKNATDKLNGAASKSPSLFTKIGAHARDAGAKLVVNFKQAHDSIDKFNRDMDKAQVKMRDTWNEAKNSDAAQVGEMWSSAGKKMSMGITLPIVGAGVAALKTGMDFQEGMSKATTVIGATGKEIEQLQDQAIKLGADTSFSASEAAAGMDQFGSAGFNAKEVMSGMAGVMDLAAVSGGDVAMATENAATAIRSFGLETDKSTHVADVFARAAADTNAETLDMGEGLKYVGAVAHSTGNDLEDTAAAIGVLSDNAIKGSQAGTVLRASMLRLSTLGQAGNKTQGMFDSLVRLGGNEIPQFKKIISEYSVEFTKANAELADAEAKGNAKRMKVAEKTLKDLSLAEGTAFSKSFGKEKFSTQVALLEKMKKHWLATGQSVQDYNGIIKQLVGTEAMTGVLALIDTGSEKLKTQANALRESDGAAKEMAKSMQNNAKGGVEAFKGSIESLAISLERPLDNAIGDTAREIGDVIDKFTDLDDKTKMTGLTIAGLAAAAGPLMLAIGKFKIFRAQLNAVGGLTKNWGSGGGTAIPGVPSTGNPLGTGGSLGAMNVTAQAVYLNGPVMSGNGSGNPLAGGNPLNGGGRQPIPQGPAPFNGQQITPMAPQPTKAQKFIGNAGTALKWGGAVVASTAGTVMKDLDPNKSSNEKAMGTMGTVVGGAAGAAIGTFLGNPALGMTIGANIGNAGGDALGKKIQAWDLKNNKHADEKLPTGKEATEYTKESQKAVKDGKVSVRPGEQNGMDYYANKKTAEEFQKNLKSADDGYKNKRYAEKPNDGNKYKWVNGTGWIEDVPMQKKLKHNQAVAANSVAKSLSVATTEKVNSFDATSMPNNKDKKGNVDTAANSADVSAQLNKNATAVANNAKQYDKVTSAVKKYQSQTEKSSDKNINLLVKQGIMTRKEADAAIATRNKADAKRYTNYQKSVSKMHKIDQEEQSKIANILQGGYIKLNGKTLKGEKALVAIKKKYGKERKEAEKEVATDTAKILTRNKDRQTIILSKIKDAHSKASLAQIKDSKKALDEITKTSNEQYKKKKKSAEKTRDAVIDAADKEYYVNKSISKKQHDDAVEKAKAKCKETTDAAQKEKDQVITESQKMYEEVIKRFSGMVRDANTTLQMLDVKFTEGYKAVNMGQGPSGKGVTMTQGNKGDGNRSTNTITGDAFATGGTIKSNAQAMVGELGPELAYNTRTNRTRLLGSNGPELASVQSGEHIINAADTSKMMKGGMGSGRSLPGFNPDLAPGGKGVGLFAKGTLNSDLQSLADAGQGTMARKLQGMKDQADNFPEHTKKSNDVVYSSLAIPFKQNAQAKADEAISQAVAQYVIPDIGGGGGSAASWSSTISAVAKAMQVQLSSAGLASVIEQIQTESGGNQAIKQQVKDINSANGHPAQGLLQYIPSTFNAYKINGRGNILSGVDQLFALFNDSNWFRDIAGKGGWGPSGKRRFDEAPGQFNAPAMGAGGVVGTAKALGEDKPYKWAASGPDAYDCSGLVAAAFKQYGVNLPHNSFGQWNATQHVSRADAKPGDIVAWGNAGKGHVGLYEGGNSYYSALSPNSRPNIKSASLTPTVSGSKFLGFGRVPGFAKGGRPKTNQVSIVGEKGPEFFVPDVPGRVHSNSETKSLLRDTRKKSGKNGATFSPNTTINVYAGKDTAGSVAKVVKRVLNNEAARFREMFPVGGD